MNVLEMQARIAERAYAIWQAEGCRHGEDAAHWNRAEAEVAAEVTPIKAKRAPAKKATEAAKAEAVPAKAQPKRRAKAA